MFSHRSNYFFGNAANLWHIFIFAGVFSLTAPYFINLEVSTTRTVIVGCVSIVIGILLRFNYTGVQINFNNHQYRYFTAILGIKTGSWEKLPILKKIVLTDKNVSSWNTPNGISPTFKTNNCIYTIALFSESDQPILYIQTENEKEVNEKAASLADSLNIPLESRI